jgi:hypothetical protein
LSRGLTEKVIQEISSFCRALRFIGGDVMMIILVLRRRNMLDLSVFF